MVDNNNLPNSLANLQKIEEAKAVLRDLGLPLEQQNERSALTLLALVNLKVDMPWVSATNPPLGITPIMQFISEFYGKTYAPNTRETIRRQTVHQFVEAGLLVVNPDQPSRPTNSPKTVYQIEAVTSHGPMTPKRCNEFKLLFRNSTAGLVFVSAFERRRDLAKYLNEIAWETEVWVAEAPTHIIHFNGERFLGPY